MKTTLALLRCAFFCFALILVLSFGGLSLTDSTTAEQPQRSTQPDQATHNCDIDGSVEELEHCPPEEVIRQYRERYDMTVVQRGGTLWVAESKKYVNTTYGYSVTLPDGVLALSCPPPAPWHGFIVDVDHELSESSNVEAGGVGRSWDDLEAGLWVDGSHNATDYNSVDEAANHSLTYLKAEHPDDLIILEWEHTTLNEFPAIHYCIQFRSTKSGETLITDETIALPEDLRFIYTITLTSRAARYREDQAVLKQILEGWNTTDFD